MLVKWRGLFASTLIFFLVFSALGVSSLGANSQNKNKADKGSKRDKAKKGDKTNKEPQAGKDEKKEKKKDSAAGGNSEPRPVLWQEPTDLESRDLFNGPGGADGAPDPKGKFTFVERSKSGTSEKIHVDDDRGRKWQVKFGAE